MRDRLGIFGAIIRNRKLSLLLVMSLRMPNSEPKDGGVLVEDASSSSDISLSTVSNTTLKNDKTTDAERKRERRP